jgi:hypothetical protein
MISLEDIVRINKELNEIGDEKSIKNELKNKWKIEDKFNILIDKLSKVSVLKHNYGFVTESDIDIKILTKDTLIRELIKDEIFQDVNENNQKNNPNYKKISDCSIEELFIRFKNKNKKIRHKNNQLKNKELINNIIKENEIDSKTPKQLEEAPTPYENKSSYLPIEYLVTMMKHMTIKEKYDFINDLPKTKIRDSARQAFIEQFQQEDKYFLK